MIKVAFHQNLRLINCQKFSKNPKINQTTHQQRHQQQHQQSLQFTTVLSTDLVENVLSEGCCYASAAHRCVPIAIAWVSMSRARRKVQPLWRYGLDGFCSNKSIGCLKSGPTFFVFLWNLSASESPKRCGLFGEAFPVGRTTATWACRIWAPSSAGGDGQWLGRKSFFVTKRFFNFGGFYKFQDAECLIMFERKRLKSFWQEDCWNVGGGFPLSTSEKLDRELWPSFSVKNTIHLEGDWIGRFLKTYVHRGSLCKLSLTCWGNTCYMNAAIQCSSSANGWDL